MQHPKHNAGDEYVYSPIIKHKNFEPNPVALYGIPDYADSSRNPKVEGTAAWEDWWNEQIYYCINGYDTGGMHIPGRYYYYLNFYMMSTVGIGNHYPPFVDLDYEFFNLVEQCKEHGYGIISLKARRKGLSNKVVGGVIDYGFRFRTAYSAGIVAGLEEHATDFYDKFKHNSSMKPPEFRMNVNFTKDKAIHKYRVREKGIWVDQGTFNTVYVATMFNNPGVFKGKYLDDCVFEEAGEFSLLIEGYEATKPCFMKGDRMVGTSFIYGTGGNLKKGSQGFAEMWHEPESFRLIKFWVPADRVSFYYIGGISGGPMDPDKTHTEDIPNLIKYKPYERTGMEDVEQAKKGIEKERSIFAQKKNKKSYYEHLQNYPLTEKEAFLRFTGNDFPTEELNTKLFEIDSNGIRYTTYKLSWKKEANGALKMPREVVATAMTDEQIAEAEILDTENIVHVFRIPYTKYAGLDVAGIDSYDLDKSQTSKSLGGMVVYRRDHNIPNLEKQLPVALVNYRPKRKEIFYETCAMVAVWYNIRYGCNVDVDRPAVIKHFEDLGLVGYLAPRPRKFEAPDSKQGHEFGTKLTSHSKPQMIGILQSYFSLNCHKIEFPQILDEALDYDVVQKVSDWDTVDAFGLALMRDADMIGNPYNEDEYDDDAMDLPEWTEDSEGNLIRVEEYNQGGIDNQGRYGF